MKNNENNEYHLHDLVTHIDLYFEFGFHNAVNDIIESINCNLCGLSCKLSNDQNCGNSGLINQTVGGGWFSTPGNGDGALDDMKNYTFSLCEFCLDWLFSVCKIPVIVHNAGLEEFISAEERVKNDDWRTLKENFFQEFEKRNKARNLEKKNPQKEHD